MLQKWLIAGIIINALLLVYGCILIPDAMKGNSGLWAVSLLLLLYFAGVVFGSKAITKMNPLILYYVALFGTITGILFFIEIAAEYIVLPDAYSNTIMGYVEFGSAFFIYFFAGFWGMIKTRHYRSALLTAAGSAIVASLIWFMAVLSFFYLFYNTYRQQMVLRAEGDYEDFKNSGLHNFNAFIMQDLWGAGFYHLLLGVIIAGLLGSLGALTGWLLLKVKDRYFRY